MSGLKSERHKIHTRRLRLNRDSVFYVFNNGSNVLKREINELRRTNKKI